MKKLKRWLSVILFTAMLLSVNTFSAYAAITSAATPTNATEAELKWSVKLGTGYVNAPSVPTVYGDYVFTMYQHTLYKLNAENGETLQSAEMSSIPSFGYTPVLVENGTVFCPLENGTVEAFDLETMKRLWLYTDPLGGQALSPITFSNGLIYTGFWNDEDADANYICLDAESGTFKWSFPQKGGFYWAEPAFTENYLILGGDNGSSDIYAPAAMRSVNKLTGEIIDTAEIIGDQRSGITEYKGYFYSVTKAGYIYKTKLNKNGSFSETKFSELCGASTSTPAIHEDNIYIGVQTSGFSGKLSVLDAGTLELKNTVDMKGYPQSEVLVSTAYDDIYVYSTYNSSPGGITVIDSSFTANELYTPENGSRSYCISTVNVTNDGTLIYKNDSGTIFAVGNTVKEEPKKSFFERIIDWFKNIFSLIIGMFI